MPRPILVALSLPLALFATGCRESAPDSGAAADTPASAAPVADQPPASEAEGPAADALPPIPSPPLAEGAEIVYACGSTEMYVRYEGGNANVILYSGRVIPLVRNAGAAPGAEEYAGEGMVLRRSGNVVEVQQDGGEAMRCEETGGSA